MRINERLNLVIPIYGEDNAIVAWVHSMPLSREVFEANYLLIAKTFTLIFGLGLGEMAGPRVAAFLLRDTARKLAGDNPADTAGDALLAEIHRLTNVSLPSEKGWEVWTYDQVLKRKLLSDDDVSEVESALVFFTVVSAMHRRQVAEVLIKGGARLWGAQTSYLNITAFQRSLPTSTTEDSSGAQLNLPLQYPGPTTRITSPDGQVRTSSLPS